MNMERAAALANFIADRQVEMSTYFTYLSLPDNFTNQANANDCNTVACIAGWCSLMNATEYEGSVFEFSRGWLGLIGMESDHLFTPCGFESNILPSKTQRARALKVLRGEIPLTNYWLIGDDHAK